MLATASLFDVMEQDDTQRRIAARRALALAHQRVESNLGRFLRAAQNTEEFMERLALIQDDFAGYVSTASQEVGHDHPEHIAAALKDHYRIAAQKPVRHWAPRPVSAGKQGSPLAEDPNPYGAFLGPNPNDLPGSNFVDGQGLPGADPLRNQQGYIRPGWPKGIGEFDEGYEQQPNQVAMDPQGAQQIAPNLPGLNVPRGAPIHQGAFPPEPSLPVPGSGRQVGLGDPVQPQYPPQQGQQQPQPQQPQFQALDPNMPDAQNQGFGGAPDMGEFGDQLGQGLGMGQPQPHPMSPEYRQRQQPGPWTDGATGEVLGSAQDTTMQDDDSSRLVSCPQCGGSGKTANQSTCSKCKGKGKVPNFGDSMVDALGEKDARTAEKGHGNTDLGGPEPTINKHKWTPSAPGEPEVPGHIKHKDILAPIPARNDGKLEEIDTKTEKQSLPTQKGDEPFATGGEESGPHTKTFGDGKAADPVTRETISSTGNPLADMLQAEWPTDTAVEQAFSRI